MVKTFLSKIWQRKIFFSLLWLVVLAVLLVMTMFPSFMSQEKQAMELKKTADKEVAGIMGPHSFKQKPLGEHCWEYGSNKGKGWMDGEKGRSCSYSFELVSDLPKSKITELITAAGWKKAVRDAGSNIERYDYTKEGSYCEIYDYEILSVPNLSTATGDLVKIRENYSFSCYLGVYDSSLKSYL